jgi:hypothetical protein
MTQVSEESTVDKGTSAAQDGKTVDNPIDTHQVGAGGNTPEFYDFITQASQELGIDDTDEYKTMMEGLGKARQAAPAASAAPAAAAAAAHRQHNKCKEPKMQTILPIYLD